MYRSLNLILFVLYFPCHESSTTSVDKTFILQSSSKTFTSFLVVVPKNMIFPIGLLHLKIWSPLGYEAWALCSSFMVFQCWLVPYNLKATQYFHHLKGNFDNSISFARLVPFLNFIDWGPFVAIPTREEKVHFFKKKTGSMILRSYEFNPFHSISSFFPLPHNLAITTSYALS